MRFIQDKLEAQREKIKLRPKQVKGKSEKVDEKGPNKISCTLCIRILTGTKRIMMKMMTLKGRSHWL